MGSMSLNNLYPLGSVGEDGFKLDQGARRYSHSTKQVS